MKKERKIINLICLFGLCMAVLTALPAAAGQARPGVQKPVRIKRPDIQAGLDVQVEKTGTNPAEGTLCYRIRPRFWAKNIGTGTAHGFRVRLKWKSKPPLEGSSWLSPGISLQPHETRTCGPDATWDINCCLVKKRKEHKSVLVTVTADADNNLWESNEGNNVVKSKVELHWSGHFEVQTAP